MTLSRHLPDEDATTALGRALAPLLRAGDCLCLYGGLGAGKTALSRATIRAKAGAEIDVPSPTYTLVNVYDVEPPIWHADLYRLSDTSEIEELGLLDSAHDSILLIEWPERLGSDLPERRLDIRLTMAGSGRNVILAPQGFGWPDFAPLLENVA